MFVSTFQTIAVYIFYKSYIHLHYSLAKGHKVDGRDVQSSTSCGFVKGESHIIKGRTSIPCDINTSSDIIRVAQVTRKRDSRNDQHVVCLLTKVSIGIGSLDGIQIGVIALDTKIATRTVRTIEKIVDEWIRQKNHHTRCVGLQILQDAVKLLTVIRHQDWCRCKIRAKGTIVATICHGKVLSCGTVCWDLGRPSR